MKLKLWLKRNYPNFLLFIIVFCVGAILVRTTYFIKDIERVSQQTNTLAEQNKALGLDIKKLSEDNKRLSEQNRNLSIQNIEYQRCNFLAFARYTRSAVPVQDDEINSCVLLTDNGQSITKDIKPASSGRAQNNRAPKASPASPPASKPSPEPAKEPPTKEPVITKPITRKDPVYSLIHGILPVVNKAGGN